MSSTVHPYLTALEQSSAVAALQLRTSEVALERCRQAVEWQFAVYEQARLLTDAVRAPLTLPLDGPPSGALQNPSQWLGVAEEIKLLLQEAQSTSQALGDQLKALSDAVTQVEHLTLELAHHNEHMQRLCQDLRSAAAV